MFKRSEMERKKKAEEREMFKTLSFGKKIEHIFTYYRAFILGTIIGTIVLISLLNVWFFNQQRPTFVQFSIYGRYLTPGQLNELSHYLHDYIYDGMQDSHAIRIDNFFSAGSDYMVSIAQHQRFMAQIMIQEHDIIIFTEGFKNQLLNMSLFLNLSYIYDPEKLLELGDRLIYIYNENYYLINDPLSSYESLPVYRNPYIIRLDQGTTLADLMWYEGNLYAAIISNTRRLAHAREVLIKLAW